MEHHNVLNFNTLVLLLFNLDFISLLHLKQNKGKRENPCGFSLLLSSSGVFSFAQGKMVLIEDKQAYFTYLLFY